MASHGLNLLGFLWVSLIFLQLLPFGYYQLKLECQNGVDPTSPQAAVQDQAVIDYLLKKGMGNAAVELTQLLQQQQGATAPKDELAFKGQPTKQDKQVVRTQRARELGAPVIYFDNTTTVSNQDCRLNQDSISWIGAGVDGPVFLGNFECANNPQQQQQWALKLVAPRQNGTYGIMEVPGVNDKKKTRYQKIHDRLVGPKPMTRLEYENVLDHFAMVVGTVDIPFHVVASKLRDLAYKKTGVHYNMEHNNRLITAAVMPAVKGQVLTPIHGESKTHEFSVLQRRQIVRDMIFIFKQMFDQNFFHCDIWPRHFMLSIQTQKVAVIDFDRIWMRHSMKGLDELRKRQFVQMLNFVGMACNNSPKDSRRKIKYEINACQNDQFEEWPKHAKPQKVVSVINPVLEKCIDLFPGEIHFDVKELDNTAEAFRKLQRWVDWSG